MVEFQVSRWSHASVVRRDALSMLAVALAVTIGVLILPYHLALSNRALEFDDVLNPSATLVLHGWVVQHQLVKHAVELNLDGYAEVVFTTGGGFDRLTDLVGFDEWADLTKAQLQRLGVP